MAAGIGDGEGGGLGGRHGRLCVLAEVALPWLAGAPHGARVTEDE